jgi:hypothetical protein
MSDDILSAREALEKAFAESPAEEEAVAEVAAETPEEETPSGITEPDGRERDEHGRFKAKDAPEVAAEPEAAVAPAPAAPEPTDISAQFSDPKARAAWVATPAEVKAEVSRRFGELQRGIETHRERLEPLRRFDEMARASGTTLDRALANYTHIEQTIARNPMEGLDLICRNMGTDIRTVAAQIMGQPAPEPNAQLHAMHGKMREMEQELHGYRAQAQQTVTNQIQDFAAAHPRFDELSEDIAWLLKTGGARDLEAAYAKADRLNPIPPAAAQTSAAVASPQEPQKHAGPVSIKGAPSSGSNPARATEILSSRDAVARAFAATR